MKINSLLLLLTLYTTTLVSQTLPKKQNQAKWQQHVDYSIQVKLDTLSRSLKGFEQFIYTNNSPDIITEFYLHLWPNAYKDKNTQLVKQQVEAGKTELYFAKDEMRGWIDSLKPQINGIPVELLFEKEQDYARIRLPQALLPGQKLTFTTPFVVKLPAKVYSRAGVENGIYCVTQWYPKPAVYDVNGWNPMSYLDQGEFYSEYGKFEVEIEVPKEMVLAATGDLQNPEELNWWNEKINNPSANNPNSGNTKSLRFVQDNIHDFAWFCSRNFKINKSEIKLNSGKVVSTWLFTEKGKDEERKKGVNYINDAVKFYSEKVGEYPYSHATVVITPLESGGGMEYPTITNCQSIDKTTIVHEVGHNWFYGILGSNEREYPWMDESLNTYYENRQSREGKKKEDGVASFGGLKFGIKDVDQAKVMYEFSARKNEDQAGNLHSTVYTDFNYGAIIYAKNPLAFSYLQSYLGTESFDKMMQAYYEKWKFKHPLPQDFINHVNQFTGKDLSWFFNDVLGSEKKQDIKICKQGNGLKIKNKGSLFGPIPVSLFLGDSLIETKWLPAENEHIIPFTSFKSYDVIPNSDKKKIIFRVAFQEAPLELYNGNNYINPNSLFSGMPWKLKPILGLESPKMKKTFITPLYAWNYYNKNMLGFALYNSLIPQAKNEFAFSPLYSFETKDINGYAQYWRNLYPLQNKIKLIQLGAKFTRFGTNANYIQTETNGNAFIYNGNASYEKLEPFIHIALKPKKTRSNIQQDITLRYVMINEQKSGSTYFKGFSQNTGILNLNYNYIRNFKLFPVSAQIDYQAGMNNSEINRLAITVEQGFLYNDGKKKAQLRFFGGMFFKQVQSTTNTLNDLNLQRSFFNAGGVSGDNDYLYDQTMFARAERPGSSSMYANQIIQRDAGFRNMANIGNTDKWIIAANLTLPIPKIKIPIGVYYDINYCPIVSYQPQTASTSYNNQLTYSGGIYLQIIGDYLRIYFPIEKISSEEVVSYWKNNGQDGFFQRTSFVLNLNALNPLKGIRNFKL